jgi:tetratricopeptide (TPR) repeat protein
MRRRLNVRFLLGMLGFAAVVCCGVYFVHGFQVKRSASGLLRQADLAEGADDISKAKDYLGRYLDYRPDDTEALARFGFLLDKGAQTPQALAQVLGVFEKVLVRDPKRADVRRRAATIAVKLQRYVPARQHLDILAKKPDGELEELLGQCDEAEGYFDKAVKHYEQAIKTQPHHIDSYVRLAFLLRSQFNNEKRANEVMDAKNDGNGLIAANRQSARAYLERAGYRKRYMLKDVSADIAQNVLKGISADIAQALKLAPEDADVLIAAAIDARDTKETVQAQALLERGEAIYPKDVRMYQEQADVLYTAGQPEKAVACLERGVEALPAAPDLKWALTNLLILTGKFDEANRQAEIRKIDDKIEELDKAKYPQELLNYLRAYKCIRSGEWATAAGFLEQAQPLIAARPGSESLTKRGYVLLGQCYERTGKLTEAHAAYSRAVSIDPPDGTSLWAPARLGLASVLATEGKTNEALQEYRRVMSNRQVMSKMPELKVSLVPTVARLLIRQNLDLPPAQRRWPEAEQLLEEVDKKAESAEVRILRAEVFAAQSKFEVARKQLEEARDRQPDQVETWWALISLMDRQGKPEALASVLDEAQRRLGDRVELRLARARAVARRGGAGATEALGKLAQDSGKFSEIDQRRLLRGVAQAYSQAGEPREAVRVLEGLAQKWPDDLDARLLSFGLALQAGDTKAAERSIAAIQNVEKDDGIVWRYCKIRLLIHQAMKGETKKDAAFFEEVRGLQAKIVALKPSWRLGVLAGAEIDDLENKSDAAITGYQKAIELGERDPGMFRRVVQLLTERHRYAEADKMTQQMLQWEQDAGSGDLQLASGASFRAQDYGRAADLARQSVKAGPNDYRNYLWLGRVLAASAQRSGSADEAPMVEAEKAFRRATELAGKEPATWLNLVQILVLVDKKAEAEAAVKEAERHLPAESAPLVLAQCYDLLGAKDAAKEHFAAAIKAKPFDVSTLERATAFDVRNNRVPDAESRLRLLLETGKSPPETTAWARRTLALLMASGTDPKRADNALKILGISESPSAVGPSDLKGLPIEDMRARAKVFALQPGRKSRQEAIGILETILKDPSSGAEDLFLLAKLHDANGESDKVRERMRALLTMDAKNPAYLAYFTNALLRQGDVSEARLWLGRLEAIQPQAMQTLVLKARVLKALQKPGEAAALLTAYAKDDPARVEAVALLLEQIGLAKAAEPLYRRFVSLSNRPRAVLTLAEYLGRRGRTDEALSLCEGAWKTGPPAAVATTCATVLQSSALQAGDDSPTGRVKKRIEDAARNAPEDPSLLIPLAVLRGLEGRYDDAETIYRQILRRDAKHVPALNNLAWLLALKFNKGTEAESLIEQAISIAGPIPALLDTRAVVRMSMNQGDRAVEDLREANAQNPTAAGYFHLAQAYQITKDIPAAAKALDQATNEMALQANDLDPLERDEYKRLKSELRR